MPVRHELRPHRRKADCALAADSKIWVANAKFRCRTPPARCLGPDGGRFAVSEDDVRRMQKLASLGIGENDPSPPGPSCNEAVRPSGCRRASRAQTFAIWLADEASIICNIVFLWIMAGRFGISPVHQGPRKPRRGAAGRRFPKLVREAPLSPLGALFRFFSPRHKDKPWEGHSHER